MSKHLQIKKRKRRFRRLLILLGFLLVVFVVFRLLAAAGLLPVRILLLADRLGIAPYESPITDEILGVPLHEAIIPLDSPGRPGDTVRGRALPPLGVSTAFFMDRLTLPSSPMLRIFTLTVWFSVT